MCRAKRLYSFFGTLEWLVLSSEIERRKNKARRIIRLSISHYKTSASSARAERKNDRENVWLHTRNDFRAFTKEEGSSFTFVIARATSVLILFDQGAPRSKGTRKWSCTFPKTTQGHCSESHVVLCFLSPCDVVRWLNSKPFSRDYLMFCCLGNMCCTYVVRLLEFHA